LCPFTRRLGVPQDRIGSFGDEKNLQLLIEIEQGFKGGPALGPVTTSSTLSRFTAQLRTARSFLAHTTY